VDRVEGDPGMQNLTLLATSEGHWVLPGTPEFLAALGDSDPDYDSVAFAIKNLGFVKLEVLEQSIVQIEMHPRNVELPALLAAQQQILSCGLTLFRIKYFETDWKSEIFSSAERTVARLSKLCTPIQAPPTTDRFIVEPKDFSRIFDEDNWLRPLALKWRVTFGRFDASVISLALAHGLLPRLMIVGTRPKSEPTWRFIGQGQKWIGDSYHYRGIGEKVENMPDKDYGAWVTEYYKSVAAAHQPRYDLITGWIQYQDERGKPVRFRSYERLMLPWRTSSDEVFVTMCSMPTDNDGSSKSPDSITDPPAAMKLVSSS
jgi:hypothetical protein